MLSIPKLTPEQRGHWESFLARMRDVEVSERDGDDPWLFHGTSAIRAAWIRREGFRPSWLRIQHGETPARPGEPIGTEGVNWGTVNVAAWAAEKSAAQDDPPVILAARLSDLRRAGALVPDHFALDTGCNVGSGVYEDRPDPEGETSADPDWRESLARSGAIGVVGCSRVDGMAFHEPLRHVPVHPDWEELRQERMSRSDGAFKRMPPRGMREPTPRTHPPTIDSAACFRQGMLAVYGRGAIFDHMFPEPEEAAAPAP